MDVCSYTLAPFSLSVSNVYSHTNTVMAIRASKNYHWHYVSYAY